jgi:hypothetical protein
MEIKEWDKCNGCWNGYKKCGSCGGKGYGVCYFGGPGVRHSCGICGGGGDVRCDKCSGAGKIAHTSIIVKKINKIIEVDSDKFEDREVEETFTEFISRPKRKQILSDKSATDLLIDDLKRKQNRIFPNIHEKIPIKVLCSECRCGMCHPIICSCDSINIWNRRK